MYTEIKLAAEYFKHKKFALHQAEDFFLNPKELTICLFGQ